MRVLILWRESIHTRRGVFSPEEKITRMRIRVVSSAELTVRVRVYTYARVAKQLLNKTSLYRRIQRCYDLR